MNNSQPELATNAKPETPTLEERVRALENIMAILQQFRPVVVDLRIEDKIQPVVLFARVQVKPTFTVV